MMKPHVQLEDVGVVVDTQARRSVPPMSTPTTPQHAASAEGRVVLRAGGDEPAQQADDERRPRCRPMICHSVLLQFRPARRPSRHSRRVHAPVHDEVRTPAVDPDAPFARSWPSVPVSVPAARATCAGTLSSSASTVRCTSRRSAPRCSRRTTRLPPVGLVGDGHGHPGAAARRCRRARSASSRSPAVSTRRVATSRRGLHSTISPCGAPAARRSRRRAGRARRRTSSRRRAAGRCDHVGDVADGAVRARARPGRARPRRAARGTSRTPLAGGLGTAISGRPPRPRTRPG